MDKSKNAVLRAKITYFFKETFRAHSKAEYKEIFSRGLNEDNGGLTAAFPWLYVRAFFALFMLFTVNILVLRLTDNLLYAPSVSFLGGITFTIPFIVLLYELYPKRDVSLFLLFAILVVGGTLSGVFSQVFYAFMNTENKWLRAIDAGLIEELCKAVTAIFIIAVLKKKNAYACFLIAAAVGAGFSVIEDMGYIFYYSNKYISDIRVTVSMFVDRGVSSFCTHILWTGMVGWAYSLSKRPFRSVGLLALAVSIVLHICWDLPLDGALEVLVILLCAGVAAAINITIVHKSRIRTLAEQTDLQLMNEQIIIEAKQMGERMRFTNAANLTFALTCTVLSAIVLILCSLTIGMEYRTVEYENREQFIAFMEGGYNLKADRNRKYDPNGKNVEERFIDGELSYVIQSEKYEGYDGVYFYGYYIDGDGGELDGVSVELDDMPGRISGREYEFGSVTEWVFEVNYDSLIDYNYHKDGRVTAVINAEEFEGYNFLIGLCATGCAVSIGSAVVITAFSIKLRRVKNEKR